MVDLLGLDKLASSMALSMCAQAAGIMAGPTTSGNGTFNLYFNKHRKNKFIVYICRSCKNLI